MTVPHLYRLHQHRRTKLTTYQALPYSATLVLLEPPRRESAVYHGFQIGSSGTATTLDTYTSSSNQSTFHHSASTPFAVKMPSFVLSKDITDADWDPIFAISIKAFQDNPEVLALSGGLSPANRAENVAAFKRDVFEGSVERVYAKITEVESGQIISFISARVYRGPKGAIDGDLAKEPPPIEFPGIEDLEDRKFYEWYCEFEASTE